MSSWVAVIQELGREGVLPFSHVFASNKPFNAPLAGMFAQFLVTSSLVVAVPPGDAYLFMLNSMYLLFPSRQTKADGEFCSVIIPSFAD